jgi:hypothetical protein
MLKLLSNLQPWQFKGRLCKTNGKSLALQNCWKSKNSRKGQSNAEFAVKRSGSVVVREEVPSSLERNYVARRRDRQTIHRAVAGPII